MSKSKVTFPKDFWTKERKRVTTTEKDEDMIPFEWSEDVLKGRKSAILYSVKKKES